MHPGPQATATRVLALLLALAAPAAAGPVLAHSGRLLDGDGAAITGDHTFRFLLHDAATNGAQTWDSGPCVLAVKAGHYETELGRTCGAPLPAQPDGWLEVRVDAITLAPRQPLRTLPAATLASDAAKVGVETATTLREAARRTGVVPRSALPLVTGSQNGVLEPAQQAILDGLPATGGRLLELAARPASPLQGSLYFDASTKRLEVFDGTAWRAHEQPRSPAFTLPCDNNAQNTAGSLVFLTTPNTAFDATNKASGTHACSANVFYGGQTDAGLVSQTAHAAYSLHASEGDWEFEWDYRQTADNNYGLVHFASTPVWARSPNTYVRSDGAETLPPEGWIIGTTWVATYLFVTTPAGRVSWTYPGYHSTWKRLTLRRTGHTLTFLIDGVSQGTRTMPGIVDPAPRRLWIFGSPNGGHSGTTPALGYSQRSQMDNVSFRRL